MIAPARCQGCGKLYDMADGEVVHRYADCTVFKTPCCGRETDDRPGGDRLDPQIVAMAQHQDDYVDMMGRIRVIYDPIRRVPIRTENF